MPKKNRKNSGYYGIVKIIQNDWCSKLVNKYKYLNTNGGCVYFIIRYAYMFFNYNR